MKTKEKIDIANRLYEADSRRDRLEDPRFFRPLPDVKMVQEWEPNPGERVSDLFRK